MQDIIAMTEEALRSGSPVGEVLEFFRISTQSIERTRCMQAAHREMLTCRDHGDHRGAEAAARIWDAIGFP